jgi:hypothetical protein
MTRTYVRKRKVPETISSEIKEKRAAVLKSIILTLAKEISENLAECPESEWIFGRLFLLGLLTQTEYDIILRLDSLSAKYRSYLSPTLGMKIWKPETLRSFQENLSPQALKKMEEVQREYERACLILRRCGSGIDEMIFRMLDDNQLGDIRKVHIGLRALVEEF